ncbi:MAG: carbon-nitrogen hydrolase family protein, partial [Candidatus Theseobacter exili]|nr:carbon-nitrogen hydrolase family protein [Candidatus Theseobacter exili]
MKQIRNRGSINYVSNGDFSSGQVGKVPEGWEVKSPRRSLTPIFKLAEKKGRKVLLASGNGREDCVGHLTTPVLFKGNRTYQMRTRFHMSSDINPHKNLLFWFFNNGIFKFRRLSDGEVEGQNRFFVPGKGDVRSEVRIFFQMNAKGKVWINEVSLEECEPIPSRLVSIACVATEGRPQLKTSDWEQVLDVAGKSGVDLILLPECMEESLEKPISIKAAEYGMYISGAFHYTDKKFDRIYNRALLFDRKGKQIGHYDKIHPYDHEILLNGRTPGTEAPVFKTDFGVLGIMICYDSWFPDVAELLALKGAEIILFPNASYYRSLMPARAADNCVRIIASSCDAYLAGIWDTTGTEVTALEADPTCWANYCRDYRTFKNVHKRKIGKIEMLSATLDLSQSPSPHNWGGPMNSAPGGRRNR